MSQAWYERWFNEDYALLYRHRGDEDARAQCALILSSLHLKPPARILDLGCGEGRHSFLFAEAGFEVTGQDLSPHLIERARARSGEAKNPIFVRRDMRTVEGRYDLVVCLFTSFGYFADEENAALANAVAASLNPDGTFWIDFLNAHSIFRDLSPLSERVLENGKKVREERRVEAGRIIKKITFLETGETYEESVRLYSKNELEGLLSQTGLRVEGSYGSYEGDAWSPDSLRTILFARKKG